jgi:DNA-binding response OmpR family regulator
MPSTKSVLIVDDEPNVRLMLRTTLESAGYRVREAADGVGALAHLRAAPSDLVILDLRMPNLNGMETLRRLRDEGDGTPVVMLTAHGSIPDAVAAMKLGTIDFLTKPITPQALRLVVAEVIHRQYVLPARRPEALATVSDRSQRFAFDFARGKRALNRGEFDEAERLLQEAVSWDPDSDEAHELLDRLLVLKESGGHGSFRMLRDWFPHGTARGKP